MSFQDAFYSHLKRQLTVTNGSREDRAEKPDNLSIMNKLKKGEKITLHAFPRMCS